MSEEQRFRTIDFSQEQKGEGGNIDEEISLDAGTEERKRIDVSGLSAKEIQEKFKVSRTSAWRAEKRGWLYMNYHNRLVDMDNDWAKQHIEDIRESSKSAAIIALRTLGLSKSELTTLSIEDLESKGVERILELTGHPDRDSNSWRTVVARNAILNLLHTQIINPDKHRADTTSSVSNLLYSDSNDL